MRDDFLFSSRRARVLCDPRCETTLIGADGLALGHQSPSNEEPLLRRDVRKGEKVRVAWDIFRVVREILLGHFCRSRPSKKFIF